MELSVRSDTDTAHPQDSVPIYLIHTIKNPMCNRSGCWCQANQARIVQLLEALKHNELHLAPAASFGDGQAK